ncbi:hypothetical protein EJB05_00950, partial [Eragrostis curvula]
MKPAPTPEPSRVGAMYHGFEEKNTDTTGSIVLGVSPETEIGSVKASENATESGEAGHGCGCGSGCSCSPCDC